MIGAVPIFQYCELLEFCSVYHSGEAFLPCVYFDFMKCQIHIIIPWPKHGCIWVIVIRLILGILKHGHLNPCRMGPPVELVFSYLQKVAKKTMVYG